MAITGREWAATPLPTNEKCANSDRVQHTCEALVCHQAKGPAVNVLF